MVSKTSVLYVMHTLAFALSIDCPDVVNLAIGFNMGESNPSLLRDLKVDCCAAPGVDCYNNHVDSIYWYDQHLTGSINSTALPETLYYLELNYNRISGNFPKTLPPNLNYIYLSNNLITGELSSIPLSKTFYVDVGYNKLNGTIPVFPSTLEYFYAQYNILSGCIPRLFAPITDYVASNNLLSCSIPAPLPQSLGYFVMTSNKLTGPIPSLPEYMYGLYLGWNQISGELPLLPAHLFLLDLQSLDVNGTIYLTSPSYISIANSSISNVTLDNTSYLRYCDMRDTNLINDVNDPQLSRCDRSMSLSSTISDCEDVINFSYGLNMHVSNPDIMRGIEFNCCLVKQHITCDATNVTEINFQELNLEGTINGTAVPSLTQKLNLGYNFISGAIPENLPNSLRDLNLQSNFLTGFIPSLPYDLIRLRLNVNWLNGSIPATLPSNLNFLYVNNNYLTGILPIVLPDTLTDLNVYGNRLSGEVPIFPDGIKYIMLSYAYPSNRFTGQLFTQKPISLLIAHNYISNVTIKDTSTLSSCDISNNPLLSRINDPPLTNCTKSNLYIVDCVDVIGLAVGLNLDVVQPDLMASIETNCCSSAGVTCAAGRVDKIEWPNMNLNGTIETSHIPSNLIALDLSQNSITGPVPVDMPSSLVNLTLHSNKLSGVIPSVLPLSLEHLDLSDNMINGSIPTVLPTGLLSLLLNKNKLSGSLPSSIPSGVVSLDVSNNNLSGPVPDLSSIEYIYLNRDVPPYNQFTGGISVLNPKELYVPNNLITNILINDTQQLVICNITNNPLLVNANDASLSSCVKDGLYNQSTSYFTSTMEITSSVNAASSVSDNSSATLESTALSLTGTLDLSKSTDYKETLQSVSMSTVATLSKSKTGTTVASIDTVSAVDESLESILRSRSLRIRSRQQSATGTARYSSMTPDVVYSNTLQAEFIFYTLEKYRIDFRLTYYTAGRCVLSTMVALAVLYYTPFTRSIRNWRQRKNKSSNSEKNGNDKPFKSIF